MNEKSSFEFLSFPLLVDDDWPPFSMEVIPFEVVSSGYRCAIPPLYVKKLAVNDIISVSIADNNIVEKWNDIYQSNHSTIWILRTGLKNKIDYVLDELERLGCKTVRMDSVGSYSVDVPEVVKILEVDKILGLLNNKEAEVAFPAFRHLE